VPGGISCPEVARPEPRNAWPDAWHATCVSLTGKAIA
jgi:hypothetical protein